MPKNEIKLKNLFDLTSLFTGGVDMFYKNFRYQLPLFVTLSVIVALLLVNFTGYCQLFHVTRNSNGSFTFILNFFGRSSEQKEISREHVMNSASTDSDQLPFCQRNDQFITFKEFYLVEIRDHDW